MNNDFIINVANSGKEQIVLENNKKYVYISKKRLEHLEYLEKNLSTIIEQAVLKSEETENKKK